MGCPRSPAGSRTDSETTDDVAALADPEIEWPFGRIDSLRRSDLRETAYEIFFMSCRSSPGFGGGSRGSSSSLVNLDGGGVAEGSSSPPVGGGGGGGWTKGGGTMMVVTSKIKKTLGLKARRATQPMRPMSHPAVVAAAGGPVAAPNSPGRKVQQHYSQAGKVKRPMTSAEIMRQQMRVAEQSDNRLRKTLMRTLVGQAGRRAETIILPLELLRQLKPAEFNDMHEYHRWQRRQLRILEAGLLLHPTTPLERLNSAALRFQEIMRASEAKPIDTSKNSEAMRTLYTSVTSLAWRTASPSAEACHWADGFPLNAELYLALLRSIFDLRDETVVLDEVDELVELMKRTWPTLGINRSVHNVCFAWTLFYQYVATGQVEPDLVNATLAMLAEVANDAKRVDGHEPGYIKVLSGTLTSIQTWAERRLLDYHENFDKGTLPNLESLLNLALSAAKIIAEDIPSVGLADHSAGNRIEYYIRTAIRSAFTKILENGRHVDSMIVEVEEDPTSMLTQLARDTEVLAAAERETFSPVLKRWHPAPGAVAVAALHGCFGVVLKQYMARVTSLTNELVQVLHSAGKLERVMLQMVAEEAAECEDGGKAIAGEMVPYEVDSIIMGLLKSWTEERLRIGRQCLNRANETESWIPRSKTEPFAQSAVDLMKLAKVTVDEFFEIPVVAREDMVQDLADGLEALFQDYTAFVAACGSKQSYVPTLPPLTRCNQESRFVKLWKKATPCRAGAEDPSESSRRGCVGGGGVPPPPPPEGHGYHQPRPSTSRGTQRLYIRLNTLHYIYSHIHALDKSLSFFNHGRSPAVAARIPSHNNQHHHHHRRLAPSHHFDLARSAIQSAIQQVAEVAAYRLIFLDSHHSFYDGLYVGDVASSRIRPALRTLKQNLTFLVTVLTDRAQPAAVREVMRAAFEAFLMVLLAGGSERAFVRSDYEMVVEDFKNLKRLFCTCGEGLVAEEVVDREAETVEGVVALMGHSSEQLVEDFSILTCETTASGMLAGMRVPMPPTTGRWNRGDPNTVLRVLAHRNDDVADQFLKRAFQLPKRR